MRQFQGVKVLIFFLVLTCPIFSNEKNLTPKTSCDKEDCKIQVKVKVKEKNKLQNFDRESVISIQRNLVNMKYQSLQNRETQKRWEERIGRKLYEENNLKVRGKKNLEEVYNKELKFSATGN